MGSAGTRRTWRLLAGAVLLLLPAGLAGCSGLGREINEALPEFMQYDPGREEEERLGAVRRWREASPEEVAAQKSAWDEAVAFHAAENYEEAGKALEAYLENYPEAAFDRNARWLLGDTRMKLDDYDGAFAALKGYVERYPVSDLSAEIAAREYAMGLEYLSGRRSTFFGIFSHESTGIEILKHVVESFPRGATADDAQWAIANWYLDDEDWEEAWGAFTLLVERFPDSEWRGAAQYRRAYAHYRMVKGIVYDIETIEAARDEFLAYLNDNPEGDRVVEAREKVDLLYEMICEKDVRIGDWYIGQGKPGAARFYLERAARRTPPARASGEARALLDGLGAPPAIEPPGRPGVPSAAPESAPSGPGPESAPESRP